MLFTFAAVPKFTIWRLKWVIRLLFSTPHWLHLHMALWCGSLI